MLTRREWAAVAGGAVFGCSASSDEASSPTAPDGDDALLARTIVFDAHCDTPGRMLRDRLDLSQRRPYHQVDIPRLREGGISASFFAVFTPAGDKTETEAVERGLETADAILETVAKHPDDFTLALSTRDIENAKRDGKIAILLALEGGHMIDSSLAVLRGFHELGVRSMGLVHSRSIAWAKSAEDEGGPAEGLTDFGADVVRELNRLGVLIDLAHAADSTFYKTLEISEAPIISSHTACRSLVDTPRNMSDDMLRALGENGGVIAIGYYNGMIVPDYGKPAPDLSDLQARRAAVNEEFAEDRERRLTELWKIAQEEAERLGPVPFARLIDHFEHAAQVAGVDHVALGSDLDAAGMRYPVDAADIADTPKLIPGLRGRGFSDEEIAKMLGGNMMRVLAAAEAAAG